MHFLELGKSLEVRNWAYGRTFSSSTFWKTRIFAVTQPQVWGVSEPRFRALEVSRRNYCGAITWSQRTETSFTVCVLCCGSYSIQTASVIHSDNDFGSPGILAPSPSFSLVTCCPFCCIVAGQTPLTDVFETWVA